MNKVRLRKNLILDKTFVLAIQNHKKNNIKAAEDLYNKVLKMDPNHSNSLNNLGILLQGLGDNQKAIYFLEKAVQVKPSYADAHYNLGSVFQKINMFQKAKKCFEKTLKINYNHSLAHLNLGVVLNALGQSEKAMECYLKTIEIDPNNVKAHYNIANIFNRKDDFQNAIISYEKAIKIDPNYINANYNIANMFNNLGDLKNALKFYHRTLELKPDHLEAQYSIGIMLYTSQQYKEAAKYLDLIDHKKSKSFLLDCLYTMDNIPLFLRELNNLINRGTINSMIGSICSRAEKKYEAAKQNPFCKDPLKYVLKSDLTKKCDFKNTFIKVAKNILTKNIHLPYRQQPLLYNATQTSGNLFTQKNINTIEIQKVIHSEIKKYRSLFKDSEEGFLKNWPNDYHLYGWLISMKSGGKIKPHIHNHGWLSGSVYINVPKKLKIDSGNLVLSIDKKEYKNEKNINSHRNIDVTTGSLCLFPASLHHYTIPFEAEVERIVLAFDVLQTD